MGNKPFSGVELLEAVRAGTVTQPLLTLNGMLEPGQNPDHILFSLSSCDDWITIPSSMIASGAYLGKNRCGEDHFHPVYSLTFGEPEDPVAQALYALLIASVMRL